MSWLMILLVGILVGVLISYFLVENRYRERLTLLENALAERDVTTAAPLGRIASAKPDDAALPDAARLDETEGQARHENGADADGPIFVTPVGKPDNLQDIKGIGPQIEGKLNALGITTFAQIASFTQEDVAKVDAMLRFKGRIERERWIEQARRLVSG